MAGKSLKIQYKNRLWTRLELARAHGLAYQTFCHRLQRGETIEHALRPAEKPIKPAQTYPIEGAQLTIREIVAKYGVSYFAIRARIRRGLSMEQAVFFTPSKPALVPFHGKNVTITHLATISGLTASCIHSRIRRGLTPEDAIRSTFDLYGSKRGRLITHDGKTMNLAQWAKVIGLTRERIRQRVAEAEAAGQPISTALIPRVIRKK